MTVNRNRYRKLSCLTNYGTFVPAYFRSLELSFPGTFAPESENDVELSLPGTFAFKSKKPSSWSQNMPARNAG